MKYAGIVPESYLETLLSLPPETFSFFCLQKLESRDRLAGRYSFSRQFGPLSGLEEIDAAIFNESCDFLQAMRSSTGHIFLKEAVKAQKRGEKMLLVEDGGYLAPVLNRFCLEEASVDEVFIHFRMEPPAGEAGKPFAEWLDRIFLGGIEHTRNGYDADLDVQAEFSTLHFPVASIAVSNLKRGTEARECAVSILTSTEMILHRLGVLLSRRTVVLLGSCGAIGGHLKTELMHRLERGKLYGVDTASKGKETGHGRDVPALDDLGRGILRSADLFIGVVGKSILKAGHIEDILAHGTRKKLFFVSGSTKTVEFSDLENFLQSLRDQPESAVSGRPVQISWLALRDPQTGVLQGYEVNISFTGDQPENKTLYLLGELTPINFLYYGIPTEVMDEVMAQLFTVTCGLTRRQISEYKLPPELLAVDHRIDADANILPDLSI